MPVAGRVDSAELELVVRQPLLVDARRIGFWRRHCAWNRPSPSRQSASVLPRSRRSSRTSASASRTRSSSSIRAVANGIGNQQLSALPSSGLIWSGSDAEVARLTVADTEEVTERRLHARVGLAVPVHAKHELAQVERVIGRRPSSRCAARRRARRAPRGGRRYPARRSADPRSPRPVPARSTPAARLGQHRKAREWSCHGHPPLVGAGGASVRRLIP